MATTDCAAYTSVSRSVQVVKDMGKTQFQRFAEERSQSHTKRCWTVEYRSAASAQKPQENSNQQTLIASCWQDCASDVKPEEKTWCLFSTINIFHLRPMLTKQEAANATLPALSESLQ